MVESKIRQIIDEYDNYTLREFNHAVYPLLAELDGKIDEQKYKRLKTEYDCVYYEWVYWDDNEEDTNMVKMYCIEALKAILEND